MPDTKKRASFIRPTVDTPFHIDFQWWQENDSNWRIFLQSYLCEKHQELFKDQDDTVVIDAIDQETAEVTQVDGLLYELMHHCAAQKDFIQYNMPLIAKVFRVFLAYDNKPMSPNQLAELVNKPARTVLVTLTGPQTYKGIRVFQGK